ncbi:MAG: tripartite tricarboxylate transporter substrate binding protein, partial [Deltaproteobacteria bacterium]|nr:tripartite tricarboxylate transporter substrate binding protein [Deltaproteobacteria bacterium]
MRLHPTFAALSVALLLALGLIGCQAQSVPSAYPSKPIEYVLHTPAGSAS